MPNKLKIKHVHRGARRPRGQACRETDVRARQRQTTRAGHPQRRIRIHENQQVTKRKKNKHVYSESDPCRHRRSPPLLRAHLRAELDTGWQAEVLGVVDHPPKADTATITAIEKAIDAAIEAGTAKFGGKRPNKAALKLPLRDGDTERDDEAYANSFFVNANSLTPPQVVDENVAPIRSLFRLLRPRVPQLLRV